MIAIISLIISIISIFLSLYNFNNERTRLKVEISRFHIAMENNMKVLIVYCVINNCSKNSITINSIDLICDEKHNSIENSLTLGSVGVEIFEQFAEWKTDSINLPLRLSSFDSLTTSIIFPLNTDTNFKDKNKIVFNTSRGKIKLVFDKEKIDNN